MEYNASAPDRRRKREKEKNMEKKRVLVVLLVLMVAISVCGCSGRSRLVPVAERAWAQNSVNAAVFRSSSLVTFGDRQYVAFYDPQGSVVLGVRELGSSEWSLCRTPYDGDVRDAHNVISTGVDGRGVLHVAWGHHNTPLHYAKACGTGSLEIGAMQGMVGEGEDMVTYPEFYTLPDGDLLFAYRDGRSGNGNMVLNRYDVTCGEWHRVQSCLIDGEGERNAYWQMCVDGQGGLHVSWVWRETYNVETNHDLCYAYSPDGGVSWWHSDRATRYELPITAENAEYVCRIPQGSELINQTSMTCDGETCPYIATYWRDGDSAVPQYRVVFFSGGEWLTSQVGERTMPFSLSGAGSKKIPVSRPRIAVESRRDGTVEAYVMFRDEERGGRVSLARGNLPQGKWRIEDVTDFQVGSWEPSYDTKLWSERGLLHLFVQPCGQGDGETLEDIDPQPVCVLELK